MFTNLRVQVQPKLYSDFLAGLQWEIPSKEMDMLGI